MLDSTSRPRKVLIVDDDKDWRESIGLCAKVLNYEYALAESYDEVKSKIKEAEESQNPFSIVTIDMRFEIGKEGTLSLRGKDILRYCKSAYPYLACIMISGSGVPAHEILDLRDDYDLDYYISKDRLDVEMLERAINRALKRVRPLGSTERKLETARETLDIFKDTCLIYEHHLATIKQKKAHMGIDVSVAVESEIRIYTKILQEVQKNIQKKEEEIKLLEAQS